MEVGNVKNYSRNFIAGGTALGTAFAVMHPIDSFKTQLQAKTTTTILFNRSFLLSLRNGFLTSVAGSFPQGGLRLATYEATKSYILTDNSTPEPFQTNNPILASAVCAIMGDLASSVVKVPREVVTARLQTEHMKHGVKPSFFPIFKEIMKNEGFPGFFKGFAPILWRDIPFMTILFTTYESFKQFHHISQRSSSLTHFTLYGGISGSIAGFLTTPFDVVRTRIMTGEKGDGTFKICKLLMKEASRGILRTFYKGSIARSAWWFGVCSLFFPIYENLKDVLP